MRVWTELGPPGAAAAAHRGDAVILVDALRSSVTITAALAAGARQVIPVHSVGEARARRLSGDGVLVAGEQGGIAVADFDYGNSPTQLLADRERLRGRDLLLATSNGTPLVRAASGAAALLAGSLPNASAVARAALRLATEFGCDVSLLAAGGGGEPVVEDEYAVAFLAKKLGMLARDRLESLFDGEDSLESPSDEDDRLECPSDGEDSLECRSSRGLFVVEKAERVFSEGPNGRKLATLGYAADVALCARLDVFQEVGVLEGEGFVLWKIG
jgi:2-phosphosulfolactate phosphatase